MAGKGYLAFDLGAESGRAIFGLLQHNRIELREIHRFPTGMMPLQGHLQWNVYRFYEEMLTALTRCFQEQALHPESVAVDTWGVDFALFNREGVMLGLPYCYRDSRTEGMMEAFFREMPKEQLYQKTGIQFMPFNSVFQLYSMVKAKSPVLEQADALLFMPDIFNFLLSGVRSSEFSFATTSQLYNPFTDNWDASIFAKLGVNMNIMQKIVQPGTMLGNLSQQVVRKIHGKPVPVVSVASHDTASAIAAIPAEGEQWAYISSGTWSLMGIESKKPLISDKSLEFNITNEGGVGRTFRVLKNIMGLWLFQQCRAAWQDKQYSYADMVGMALTARPFTAIVDPDDLAFMNPPDMPAAIMEYCRSTGQAVPQSHAEISRTVLESLALKYRQTLDQLRALSPSPIDTIYIIGGGVQNETLCQFTANACQVPVITGPAEGTALGNILVQAMAQGDLHSHSEIREVVRLSFPSKIFLPQEKEVWENAFHHFQNIILKKH